MRGASTGSAWTEGMHPSCWFRRSYAPQLPTPSTASPPHRPHRLAVTPLAPPPDRPPARRPDHGLLVIGAGITGAMAAEALTAAGWRVTLLIGGDCSEARPR